MDSRSKLFVGIGIGLFIGAAIGMSLNLFSVERQVRGWSFDFISHVVPFDDGVQIGKPHLFREPVQMPLPYWQI